MSGKMPTEAERGRETPRLWHAAAGNAECCNTQFAKWTVNVKWRKWPTLWRRPTMEARMCQDMQKAFVWTVSLEQRLFVCLIVTAFKTNKCNYLLHFASSWHEPTDREGGDNYREWERKKEIEREHVLTLT